MVLQSVLNFFWGNKTVTKSIWNKGKNAFRLRNDGLFVISAHKVIV